MVSGWVWQWCRGVQWKIFGNQSRQICNGLKRCASKKCCSWFGAFWALLSIRMTCKQQNCTNLKKLAVWNIWTQCWWWIFAIYGPARLLNQSLLIFVSWNWKLRFQVSGGYLSCRGKNLSFQFHWDFLRRSLTGTVTMMQSVWKVGWGVHIYSQRVAFKLTPKSSTQAAGAMKTERGAMIHFLLRWNE